MASGRGKYNAYTAQERARIGKYAAEHSPAKTVRHCSKLLGRPVPETTARRLRFRSYTRTHACAYKPVSARLKSAKLAENPKIAQPPNIILVMPGYFQSFEL